MFASILLPTDGSEVAERAGQLAIEIASRFDADLYIISVAQRKNLDRGERAVERMAEAAADADIDAHTEVIQSPENPADELISFAAQHDIDAIVMGTQGRTGLDRFILGSVAMQTLRNSPIPVITVHGESEIDFEIEEILIPTDGSPSAEAAASRAIDLAIETGANLHAMYITDDRAELEAGAETPAHDVADLASQRGVEETEVIVRSGQPHLEIAGYISEAPCDIVVMGTHGRTGIRRLFIGSVTERTVRFSTVPVIAVRPTVDGATVEYLDYDVITEQGWSIEDEDLFEKASNANLDRKAFGSFQVGEGEYILDAAEAAGFDWPYYCRAGGCVNCVSVLLDGEVEMERCNSLSDEEVDEENFRLTCVAHSESDTIRLIYNAKNMDLFEQRVI